MIREDREMSEQAVDEEGREQPGEPQPLKSNVESKPQRKARNGTWFGQVKMAMIGVLVLIVIASGVLAAAIFSTEMIRQQARQHLAQEWEAQVRANQAMLTATVKETVTARKQNPVPKYMHDRGKLLMYDPLRKVQESEKSVAVRDEYDVPSRFERKHDLGRGCVLKKDGLYASYSGVMTQCGQWGLYKDFALEVQATILHGDCGGVVFQKTSEMMYSFAVCADGGFGLYKYSTGEELPEVLVSSSTLDDETPDEVVNAVKQGHQTNTIGVMAKGSDILLYINGRQVAKVEDEPLIRGRISVLGGLMNKGVEVVYWDARVWEAA